MTNPVEHNADDDATTRHEVKRVLNTSSLPVDGETGALVERAKSKAAFISIQLADQFHRPTKASAESSRNLIIELSTHLERLSADLRDANLEVRDLTAEVAVTAILSERQREAIGRLSADLDEARATLDDADHNRSVWNGLVETWKARALTAETALAEQGDGGEAAISNDAPAERGALLKRFMELSEGFLSHDEWRRVRITASDLQLAIKFIASPQVRPGLDPETSDARDRLLASLGRNPDSLQSGPGADLLKVLRALNPAGGGEYRGGT